MTSLKGNILRVENRLYERRHHISSALGEVAQSVSNKMVSPGAIVAAGLFGAMLDGQNKWRGLRLLTILQTANASIRMLLTMSSRAEGAAHGSPGDETPPAGA